MSSSVWQAANLAGGKALSSVVLLLVTASIGRLLGPAQLGRWVLMVAAGAMLHTLFVNWTHAATVRFGREEWALTGRLDRTLGAKLPIVAATLTIGAALLVLSPIGWMERWFGISTDERWIVALFAVSLWITAEAQATVQAIDRLVWQAVAGPVIALATAAAAGVLVVFGRPSLTLAALVVTVPAIVGWGGVWAAALKAGISDPRQLLPFDWVRHLAYGLPLLPTFALGYLSDWGDHLLLTRLASMAEVGAFALSYQFLVAITAANGVIATVLLPRLIAARVARPRALHDYLESEVPTICSMWMLATVWPLAALPIVVHALVEPAFAESPSILLALLVGVPASVMSSLYTVLFNVEARMGRVLLYMLAITAINLAASALLIPHLGGLGAAAGTAVSYLAGQALYIQDQHRTLKVSPRRIWVLWTAGLLVGLSQYAVGGDVLARVLWAVAATAGLTSAVRLSRCADAALLRRLLAGQPALARVAARLLAPVGAS